MKVRPELKHFVQHMEDKLKKNDHKLHWRFVDPDVLMNGLEQEVQELVAMILAATSDGERGPFPALYPLVAQECVDVANYAMMIAEHYDHTRPGIGQERPIPNKKKYVQQDMFEDEI